MIRHRPRQQLGQSASVSVAIRSGMLCVVLSCLVLSGCVKFWGNKSPNSDAARIGADEIATLHRQSALDAQEPYWPQRLAEIHFAKGNVDSAAVHADLALRRDADYPAALALRSRLFYGAGQHQEAVDMLQAARARHELSPALLAGLALHLERLEAFDEADAIYTQITPQVETDGVLLHRQLTGDEFTQSLSLAEQAVGRDPRSASKLNNYAVALLYAGKPVEAKEQLLRAHELDSQLPGPLYNLAIVDRYYFFDEASARQWLKNYLQLSSEDPDGLVELFAQADSASNGETAK